IDGFVFRTEPGAAPETIQPEKLYPSREAALARYRLKPAGRWPIPEIVDYVAGHSLREVDGQWGWKFDPRIFASVNSDTVRDDLRGQPIRAEFIRAGNSETVGEAALASFRANLPLCGEPVTIPLCHHHVMLEDPASLVATLESLLGRPLTPACAALPETVVAPS
ncbi:MAG: alpha/beta hydrolase, partial [Sphingomonadales bacterium]|nr:alpha/beta hydrolase [Sphingomonadales bacterium]